MNNVYLSEAFKELKLLNEAEEYNLSADPDSVKDAIKMLDDDEISIKSFDVVDGEADTEEDLQDSYEGKVILDCTICHSMSYKDREDVVIDEETGYANVDEECPFCCTAGGFKIIGQVAPYVDEEKLDVEVEEPEKVEESLGRRIKKKIIESRELNESGETYNSNNQEYHEMVSECADLLKDTLEEYEVSGEDAVYDSLNDVVNDALIYSDKQWIVFYHNTELSVEDLMQEEDYNSYDIFMDDIYRLFEYKYGKEFGLKESLRKNIKKRIKESCNKKVNKKSQLKESARHSWRGCKDIDFIHYNEWDDPDLVWNGYTFNYWDIEDALWNDFLEVTGHNDSEAIDPAVDEEFNEYVQDHAVDYLNDVIYGGYFDEGSTNWRDRYNKRESLKRARKQKNESVQSTTIETDTDTITVLPSEDGSMTVTTETKDTPMEGAEMIAPLEPEVEAEIEMNEPETDEDEEGEEQEVDIPIDDFDEEKFDELGESYLKQVYDNVESYKTESIKEDGNKLVIEGMIKFNSGNNKKTSFIFEAKDVTKTGKVRFIGENKQISRGKKSFTMTGKVNEGKFISESLNYNYRAKDTNGKSNRMYGTVRTKK